MTIATTARRFARPRGLRGRLEPPGDKSIAHRALIVAALSAGRPTIVLRSPGQDVLSTAACLRALGVTIASEADGRPRAVRRRRVVPSRDATLDCGNSGTTMRLLAGALAGLPLRVTLDGDASLRAGRWSAWPRRCGPTGAEVTTTDGHARDRDGRATARRRRRIAARRQRAGPRRDVPRRPGSRRARPTSRPPVPRATTPSGCSPRRASPIRRDGLTTVINGPARPTRVARPSRATSRRRRRGWWPARSIPTRRSRSTGVGLNPTRTALVEVLQRGRRRSRRR